MVWERLQEKRAAHKEKGNGFGYRLLDPNIDLTTGTVPASYKYEILISQDTTPPRKLTPRECARLMGFPDDLPIIVSNKQAYHQFGNAVCPLIIKDLDEQIISQLL